MPLPPDTPVYNLPANGATGVADHRRRRCRGTPACWAHNYDIYFGTTPNPPLLAADQPARPEPVERPTTGYFGLPALQPGTTYYWKIVSKTMANVAAAGPVWSFTTAGTAPGANPPLPR